MSENPLKKLGELKIVSGEYEKDGGTKKRYTAVGAVFGTPHHSRLCVKFYATVFSDEKWADVYYDEGRAPRQVGATSGERSLTPEARPDRPIRIEDIPF